MMDQAVAGKPGLHPQCWALAPGPRWPILSLKGLRQRGCQGLRAPSPPSPPTKARAETFFSLPNFQGTMNH